MQGAQLIYNYILTLQILHYIMAQDRWTLWEKQKSQQGARLLTRSLWLMKQCR